MAFKVPTITTTLAGFGLWANQELGHDGQIEDGVKVIHRTDGNYEDVAETIRETVVRFAAMDVDDQKRARENASKLSKKALWKHFIKHYEKAYDTALRNAGARRF